jgi:nucleoid DNA-binding protein
MSRNNRCNVNNVSDISDRISNTTANDPTDNLEDVMTDCDARVIRSETEHCCMNTPVMPTIIAPGAFVGKIPVVLAEASITIPIMSTIKLEKRAFEIKRIKKNVFVTQCHLIPPTSTVYGCPPTTGTLFIEGFVRKNIEYATKECESTGVVSGRIRHTTVEIPFRCTTTVKFIKSGNVRRAPIFTTNVPPTEIGIYEDNLMSCDSCREPILGQDPCQQCFTSTEFFNEPVFCELISATFNECDIHINPRTSCENPTEQTFRKLTEKMLLTLKIKVLQKQQVGITALGSFEKCDRSDRSDRSDESDRKCNRDRNK